MEKTNNNWNIFGMFAIYTRLNRPCSKSWRYAASVHADVRVYVYDDPKKRYVNTLSICLDNREILV